MTVKQHIDAILAELNQALSQVDHQQASCLVDAIAGARKVFIAGAGRSGLAMRGFAMRLMHLGIHAYVVGEIVTPGIAVGDLLLVGSGSGSTASLLVNTRKACDLGAKVGLITIQNDSPIGKLSHIVLTVPAPSPKIEKKLSFTSIQPMGALFEQGLSLTLDAIIMELMTITGQRSDAMFSRHANLE